MGTEDRPLRNRITSQVEIASIADSICGYGWCTSQNNLAKQFPKMISIFLFINAILAKIWGLQNVILWKLGALNGRRLLIMIRLRVPFISVNRQSRKMVCLVVLVSLSSRSLLSTESITQVEMCNRLTCRQGNLFFMFHLFTLK